MFENDSDVVTVLDVFVVQLRGVGEYFRATIVKIYKKGIVFFIVTAYSSRNYFRIDFVILTVPSRPSYVCRVHNRFALL